MNSSLTRFALVACSLAALSVAAPAPSGVPLALSAPLVAPATAAVVPVPAPVVTAYSSQYVARNYNGIAVAPAFVPSAAHVGHPQVYAGPLVDQYLI